MLDPFSSQLVVAQLIACGATALFFGVAYPASIVLSRRRWRRLAEALGLERWKLANSFLVAGGIVGERQGFGVRVVGGSDGARALGIPTIAISCDDIPTEIDLAQERQPLSPVRAVPAAPIAEREIEIGDRVFDDTIRVRGSELLLAALLDGETRARIRTLFSLAGRVVDGTVVVAAPHVTSDLVQARQHLDSALALASRLRRPDDVVERLSVIARTDPEPRVRANALGLLASRLPEDKRVHALCREALTMPHDELRLRAAMALGQEGLATLLEIASRTQGDNPLAVRAIRALGRRLPTERAITILDEALRGFALAISLAALEALGEIGDDTAVSRLVVVLKTADGRLASAAASALGQTHHSEAEPSLLDALASGPPVVQGAAVEALAHVGTARAIQPLRALSERGERELRRAARQSVAQIQARLPGASPGQLSIADEQPGRVSLTDDERGRVSLGSEPDESA